MRRIAPDGLGQGRSPTTVSYDLALHATRSRCKSRTVTQRKHEIACFKPQGLDVAQVERTPVSQLKQPPVREAVAALAGRQDSTASPGEWATTRQAPTRTISCGWCAISTAMRRSSARRATRWKRRSPRRDRQPPSKINVNVRIPGRARLLPSGETCTEVAARQEPRPPRPPGVVYAYWVKRHARESNV